MGRRSLSVSWLQPFPASHLHILQGAVCFLIDLQRCTSKRAEFRVSHIKILVVSPRKLEIFLISAEGRRTFWTFCCIINIAAERRRKHFDGSSTPPPPTPRTFFNMDNPISPHCACAFVCNKLIRFLFSSSTNMLKFSLKTITVGCVRGVGGGGWGTMMVEVGGGEVPSLQAL